MWTSKTALKTLLVSLGGLLLVLTLITTPETCTSVEGFTPIAASLGRNSQKPWAFPKMFLLYQNSEDEDEEEEVGDVGDERVVLNDMTWRVEKLCLEEANTRKFLKSGPRFLPYEECRRWVHVS